MKTALLTVLLLTANHIFAQVNTDSLVRVLKTSKPDTNKINLLNEISWEFKYSKPDQAKKLSEEAIDLSKKLKFHKGAAFGLKTLGILRDEAGDLPGAIKFYEQSINYYRKDNDEMGIAKAQGNIGMIYRKLERYKEAVAAFKSADKLFAKNDFIIGQSIVYQNLAMIYNNVENHEDEAVYYGEKALSIMKSLGTEDGNVYGNLGTAYSRAGRYTEAETYLKKAIELDMQMQDGRSSASWLSNLGSLYSSQKKYDLAIPWFLKAKQAADSFYETNNMMTHNALAKAYFNTGNFREAYLNLADYTKIRDSIFSLETSKQLSELKEKYQSEKKQIQIANLEKEGIAKNRQLKSEQLQKYFFAVSMIVFLALGVLLFRSLSQKKKANKIITEQKELVVEKNREITDSITYAKRLQSAILPFDRKWKSMLPDSFILYKPKDIVAGDFYWMEEAAINGEECILFAAADCTGHGVPGAMVSVVCSNALNRAVLEFDLTDPGKILDKTRELVVSTFSKNNDDVKDGMDISLCCYNKPTGKLTWAGANNPLWIVGSDGNFEEIKGDKQPIGNYDFAKPFTTSEVSIPKGSSIYLFSDGFADQFGGPAGKKFKGKQMKELLSSIAGEEMSIQHTKLYEAFEKWRGKLEQVDDICVIGVRI